MSYIVRGERIPDNCEDCKLFDGYGEECPFYAISKVDYPEKRFEKCPLEEVEEQEHEQQRDS